MQVSLEATPVLPVVSNRLRWARRCELFLGLLVWFAVLTRLGLTIAEELSHGQTLWFALVRFLGFFTNLSTLLLALVLTVPLLGPRSRLARWLWQPGVRAASLVYILIVSLGYEVLLRSLWTPQGLEWLINLLLHDVIPAGYLAYWLGFAPAGKLRWRDAFRWLCYPCAYFVYVLIRGAMLGRYPYPFFNALEHGYVPVLWNAAAFGVAFACTGLLIVAADAGLARYRSRRDLTSR
ncbi:hypothetical protein IGB42_01620 [Andreprevotia sp. IGB-42]|uniref:Pr6Pr family membrane protein n=1 Tax=Andreprevotia sp. IGB-42 TaxID=2497473 RepID=UPI001356F893|nr:Pr6Pr family membrane protein [Andreprevotia sp. IGB-42]KAF0813941.1 hypothetical protein IGB42_01620 [Andreprevotia sp. IGB-42]